MEFIDAARDLTAGDLEDIPVSFLDRLAAVDALLQNMDRTAQNPNLLQDGTGNYWAIDFGACLFLERFARYRRQMTFELPAHHFLAGRRVQPLQFGKAHPRLEIISDVPDSWLGPDGRETLLGNIRDIIDVYVQRMS